MSGHSKWSNIQGRKNAQDAKRGKIFQRISRELYVAVKAGGPDPSSNPQLRLMMDKARAANMPKDNIKRALDKGSGAGGENYEEITYEGYGPAGTAIIVQTLTDNKNRTASAIRSAFTHHGGSLGASGSVAYMFNRQGYIAIVRDGLDKTEDDFMEDAIEAGAEDVKTSEEVFEIYTDPKNFAEVRDALEKLGYELATAEISMIPENETEVPSDKVKQYMALIDELEDNDDVSEVYEAASLPD